MNKLQNTIKEHAFNESEILTRISLQNKNTKGMNILKNRWIPVAVAAAMMLAVTAGAFKFTQSAADRKSAAEAIEYAEAQLAGHPLSYAVACVDINPSFAIYMDAKGKVIDIEYVNADAEALNISSLIGLPVEQAISGIIDLAVKAGFIDPQDATEDYVIVTTVLLAEENDDSDKKLQELSDLIEDGLTDDETLDDTLKVAVIKATQVEMFEAKGKDVPMGLYVINGMIENNGEMIPVSEFVSNSDNLNKLKNRAVIVEKGQKDALEETESSSVAQDEAAQTTIPEETKANTTNPGHSGKSNSQNNTTSGSNNANPASDKPLGSTPGISISVSSKPVTCKLLTSILINGKGTKANEQTFR